MKKRRMILMIVSGLLLVAIFFSFVVSFGIRKEKDGLAQLSCIYLKDVYVENGRLFYTLTNFSLRQFGGLSCILFEKKINGEWVSTIPPVVPDELGRIPLGIPGNSIYIVEKRFASVPKSVLLAPENCAPGEYRFYHSYNMYKSKETGEFFVVGYYTIPES